MDYASGDIAWLMKEWRDAMADGGEYMTWRRLVGRYPGQSNLAWLWGLVASAVEGGYLAMTPEGEAPPDPDSQVTWHRWQMTEKGHALLDAAPPA